MLIALTTDAEVVASQEQVQQLQKELEVESSKSHEVRIRGLYEEKLETKVEDLSKEIQEHKNTIASLMSSQPDTSALPVHSVALPFSLDLHKRI